jgi:hypothetical protein
MLFVVRWREHQDKGELSVEVDIVKVRLEKHVISVAAPLSVSEQLPARLVWRCVGVTSCSPHGLGPATCSTSACATGGRTSSFVRGSI